MVHFRLFFFKERQALRNILAERLCSYRRHYDAIKRYSILGDVILRMCTMAMVEIQPVALSTICFDQLLINNGKSALHFDCGII